MKVKIILDRIVIRRNYYLDIKIEKYMKMNYNEG
jgi:hypothetical protein